MQQESSREGGSGEFDAESVVTLVAETAAGSDDTTSRQGEGSDASSQLLEALSARLRAADSEPVPRPPSTEPTDETPAAERQPDNDGSAASAEDIADLTAELRSLQAAVEELSETRQPASQQVDWADEPAAESAFEWVETAEPPVEELSERLETVDRRLEAIEAALSEVSLAELETAVERNSADHADLEARLDAELDSIEKVFEHLLSTTDELDARLDAVDEARQEALEPLRQRAARQDALVDLTQEALRHGVTEAVCHTCEQTVDLGLLETPYCPGCDRRFTGVSAGGRLPFSTARLRTAEPRGAGIPMGASPHRSEEPR